MTRRARWPDEMAGGDFEKGRANLKSVVETARKTGRAVGVPQTPATALATTAEESRSRLTVVLTAAGLPLCEVGNTALKFADRPGNAA